MQNTANIDEYVNSVYKDIFSRYAILRGFGIEWEAPNSRYGVLNPAQPQSMFTNHQNLSEFYGWLMHVLASYSIERRPMLSLYSYSTRSIIPITDVSVENIQKIAYFFAFELTSNPALI